MLGFCTSHERSHLTGKTMYRWLELVSRLDFDAKNPHAVLRPVNIQPLSATRFLSYYFEPIGAELSPTSEEILQSGHYALFPTRSNTSHLNVGDVSDVNIVLEEVNYDITFLTHQMPTFKDDCLSDSPTFADVCKYPEWFDMQVRKRDGRCVITGTTAEPLKTTWIVPPTFPVNYRYPAFSEEDDDPEWYNDGLRNQDNFRVVFFRDPRKLCSKEPLAMIPTYISLPENVPEQLGPDLQMLRYHLKWSIIVNGNAGDIMDYYNRQDVSSTLDELLGEDEGEMAGPEDPLWQTEIGQIIMAWLIHTKRQVSIHHSQAVSISPGLAISSARTTLIGDE
ncbi:hypothetical protein A0H81_07564 [Grifola frondosa]|uniref:Uncharacterized protein n=1 Tax=Grifola frondosa TaxID=5627 RepID=A0A1C7M5X6_GRIFR|nr:hypothetical protein A0H81_07564 [Grifola frondosa]